MTEGRIRILVVDDSAYHRRTLVKIISSDPRMEVVFDSVGSWVFRIDRHNPEISIDDFLRLTDDPFVAVPSEEDETGDESG